MKLEDTQYKYMMSILERWHIIASDHADIRGVKLVLMPQDDPDQIVLKVTNHPGKDENGDICIDWYDIQVYDKESLEEICKIMIHCRFRVFTN